jgi:hypothetical protein
MPPCWARACKATQLAADRTRIANVRFISCRLSLRVSPVQRQPGLKIAPEALPRRVATLAQNAATRQPHIARQDTLGRSQGYCGAGASPRWRLLRSMADGGFEKGRRRGRKTGHLARGRLHVIRAPVHFWSQSNGRQILG